MGHTLIKKPSRTHYDTLRVPRDAAPVAIHQAYQRLSQKYHPDKHSADDQVRHERIQKALNQAYAVLSNPQRRLEYNSQMEAKATKTSGHAGSTTARARSVSLATPRFIRKFAWRVGARYRNGGTAALLSIVLAVGLGRWFRETPVPVKAQDLTPSRAAVGSMRLQAVPRPPPTPPAAPPPRRLAEQRPPFPPIGRRPPPRTDWRDRPLPRRGPEDPLQGGPRPPR